MMMFPDASIKSLAVSDNKCSVQGRVILAVENIYICEQVLFVHVSTLIPPCLTDQRNFFVVLLVTREPEQTTLLF